MKNVFNLFLACTLSILLVASCQKNKNQSSSGDTHHMTRGDITLCFPFDLYGGFTVTKAMDGDYFIHTNGVAYKGNKDNWNISTVLAVQENIDLWEEAYPDDLSLPEPTEQAIHSYKFAEKDLPDEIIISNDVWLLDRKITKPLPCPRACDKEKTMYVQDETPFTIAKEDVLANPNGFALYRCITNPTGTYCGEYLLLPIVGNKVTHANAMLYTPTISGEPIRTYITSPATFMAIDNYQVLHPGNIRGYLVTDYDWTATGSWTSLTPGMDGEDVTLKEGSRKITRPLPCPRACDHVKIRYPTRLEMELKRRGLEDV